MAREIAIAAMTAKRHLPEDAPADKPKRKPIPDHIPRIEVELTSGSAACAQCGGKLCRLGEDGEPLSAIGSRTMARYQVSCGRKGEHPKDHLSKYTGWMPAPSHGLQANHCRATDGHAGLIDLYRSGHIRAVACLAHVRRKFVDVHKAQGSAIADEAITRIAQLYAVEKAARGLPSGQAGRDPSGRGQASLRWPGDLAERPTPRHIR